MLPDFRALRNTARGTRMEHATRRRCCSHSCPIRKERAAALPRTIPAAIRTPRQPVRSACPPITSWRRRLRTPMAMPGRTGMARRSPTSARSCRAASACAAASASSCRGSIRTPSTLARSEAPGGRYSPSEVLGMHGVPRLDRGGRHAQGVGLVCGSARLQRAARGGSVGPSVVQVTITPQSVNLPPGASQRFTAVVTGSNDGRVRWSADGGSVTADGVYTAPSVEGTWQVSATSAADPSATAKASVIVTAAPVISIALAPLAATVRPGGTLRFSAVVSNSPDPGVLWSISESSGGTVDASGVYTAPFAEGLSHLVARSRADPTRAAQAAISVAAAAKVTVGITPASVALRAGDKQQFTAAVAGTTDGAVIWSADAGSVDQSGLYTAPAQAGTAHVTVNSHADPSQSATAVLTVVVGTTIVVTIEPQSPTVALGASQQFTAHVVRTADTRVLRSIAEGAAGGSITGAGLYTPSASGVWHVVATSAADASAAASTAVTVPRADVQVKV